MHTCHGCSPGVNGHSYWRGGKSLRVRGCWPCFVRCMPTGEEYIVKREKNKLQDFCRQQTVQSFYCTIHKCICMVLYRWDTRTQECVVGGVAMINEV